MAVVGETPSVLTRCPQGDVEMAPKARDRLASFCSVGRILGSAVSFPVDLSSLFRL